MREDVRDERRKREVEDVGRYVCEKPGDRGRGKKKKEPKRTNENRRSLRVIGKRRETSKK